MPSIMPDDIRKRSRIVLLFPANHEIATSCDKAISHWLDDDMGNGKRVLLDWPEHRRTPLEVIRHIEGAMTNLSDGDSLTILSTSPFAWRAAEVYAAKYGMAMQVEHFMIEGNDDGTPSLVACDATQVYDSMVRPFEELESVMCNEL